MFECIKTVDAIAIVAKRTHRKTITVSKHKYINIYISKLKILKKCYSKETIWAYNLRHIDFVQLHGLRLLAKREAGIELFELFDCVGFRVDDGGDATAWS